jgi:hypothetical protein
VTDDETFKLWDSWLDRIHDDVRGLLELRFIFWEVGRIVNANPRIQKPSSFYRWMGATYSAAVTIGIRRLLDVRDDSVSLTRLLREIVKCPHVLSRARYRVTCRAAGGLPSTITERTFDRFAGKGNDFVDRQQVQADLDALTAKAAIAKGYATKAVAHLDRRGPRAVPTFKDVDDCLDLLEELVKKYFLVFRALGLISVLPVWQYDWKAIFREAWIPAETRTGQEP